MVSGLVLDDSKLWDPDFITAAKQVSFLSIYMPSCSFQQVLASYLAISLNDAL